MGELLEPVKYGQEGGVYRRIKCSVDGSLVVQVKEYAVRHACKSFTR